MTLVEYKGMWMQRAVADILINLEIRNAKLEAEVDRLNPPIVLTPENQALYGHLDVDTRKSPGATRLLSDIVVDISTYRK